jgi:hypothetical protein
MIDHKQLFPILLQRVLLAMPLLAVGCQANGPPGISSRVERINHVVVCWLKAPGDEEARSQLIDESRALQAHIPGLIHVSAGRSLPSHRAGVDTSFDVAIVMTFRDEEALRAYDEHPRHQQAVQTILKPLVARYVIYDFADQVGQ